MQYTVIALESEQESSYLDDRFFDTRFHYSMNRLSNSEFRCEKKSNENSIFQTNKVDDCLNDCLVYLNNQTHGCLAFGAFDIQFDINKHLLTGGYRIWPESWPGVWIITESDL
jgi:hypothetical protein